VSEIQDLRGSAALIALTFLPGVTAARAREYAEAGILDEEHTPAFVLAYEQAKAVVAAHAAAGVHVISYYDEAYPWRLRELRSAPNVLYARGNLALLKAPRAVAIVGTRQPTEFGVSATAVITRAFANDAFVTVSGLARGIDRVCALTSLEAGTPTVAVLGGGLDAISPTEHRLLAGEIVEAGGLLLAEHPHGTPTIGRQLVARNRLQSGLALALIVGQTPLTSGTMHTVRFAAEQGRPIYCAQPRAPHPASEGNRVLLEAPASALPELAPAFASTSHLWRQQHLGPAPLAAPLTRDNLAAVVAELAAAAAAAEGAPTSG
jgi:DNA processing protein